MRLFSEIPSLDLNHFTQGIAKSKVLFVEALGKAYSDIGFVAIKSAYL